MQCQVFQLFVTFPLMFTMFTVIKLKSFKSLLGLKSSPICRCGWAPIHGVLPIATILSMSISSLIIIHCMYNVFMHAGTDDVCVCVCV